MAAHILNLSHRQDTLLRALWADGVIVRIISSELSADLHPGEMHISIGAVATLRRRLGLPARWKCNPCGAAGKRGVDMNIPAMGKLPHPDLVASMFHGCRFEDAKVPAPRGRISRMSVSTGKGVSSMALFEGMPS